ncbi:hypothetical protein ACLB2K_007191 [Fragaria x ananassa]
MLAGRNGNLELHRCASVVGYSMLPVVILSAIMLFVPQGRTLVFGLAALLVLWATRVCTGLMVALVDVGDEHRALIVYACFLVYTLFSFLVIF